MKFMSYTLVAMAGLCFVGGLFVLTSEGDNQHGPTRNTYRIVG